MGRCGVQYGPLCPRHQRLVKNLSSVAASQAGSAGAVNVERPGYHAPISVVVQDNVTKTHITEIIVDRTSLLKMPHSRDILCVL